VVFSYFILSEVNVFRGIIWAYLYLSNLYQTFRIGCQWPPSNLFWSNPIEITISEMLFYWLMSGLWGELTHESIIFRLSLLPLVIDIGILMLFRVTFSYDSILCNIGSSFLELMYSVYGSLFYIYYCDFMEFMFVIGLIFDICSICLESILD